MYLDLRRRGNTVYYYLTKEGYEIDFLVKTRSGELKLYQVAYDIEEPQTYERELRTLASAEKELGIHGELIHKKNYLTWYWSITHGQ